MGKVRLVRKFAQRINGVDLSGVQPGDELELSLREAEMLIAEGWAAPITAATDVAADRELRPRRRRNRKTARTTFPPDES
jgi:hypothetical protein